MSLPRLAGPQVALVPVPRDLARAVLSGGDVRAALGALGLRPGPGWPHADTADALRPLAEHGDAGADGGWLITVAGEVVGDCGWRGGPDLWGDVLLGYGLAVPARGQGVATEAVAVLCAWAERQSGVRRLVADVLVGNEPSRRLLERLGFVEEGGQTPYIRLVREQDDGRVRGRHVC